jgi:hypothetical protein
MQTRPQSPQPPGAPRWVAMAYQPSSASWQVCAESPHRAPVQYALGEMAHTVRARGGDLTVSLWGPEDGTDDTWHRFDATAPDVAVPEPPPSTSSEKPTVLAERMNDRRRQVLMAGLSKAGLYDLAPDDWAAVETLVDQLDETTVRKVAHWLGAAGRERG